MQKNRHLPSFLIVLYLLITIWCAAPATAESLLAEGIEWTVGVSSLGGYEEVAGELIAVYDPVTDEHLEERFQSLFGDRLRFSTFRPGAVRVETLTQIDAGLLWHLNRYFTLDVGIGHGSGYIRQDFALHGALPDGSIQVLPGFVDADVDIFSGHAAGRLYLRRAERISPWVSFGALGRILRGRHGMWHIPSPFPRPFPDHAFEVDGSDTHGNTDFMVGAGLDVRINRRLSLDLFARQSFDNGRNVGVVLKVRMGGASDVEAQVKEALEAYAWAGRLHNKGLDFIFEHLVRTIDQPVPLPRFRELVIDGAREFARSERLENSPFAAVNEGVALSDSPDSDGPTGNARLDAILADEGRRLSETQRGHLIDLIKLADTVPPVRLLESQARRLARRAMDDRGADGAVAVLSAAALILHSATYWETNDTRWAARLPQWIEPPQDVEPALFFRKVDWKNVAKEDLKGFIGGLVKGLIKGPEGAIIEGVAAGVSKSAVEVATQLF